jgi:hypothetical protein
MIPTGELADRLRSLKGDCPHITLSPLPGATDAIYRPEDEAEPLDPALRFSGKVARDWWISSYSSMLAGAHMPALTPSGPAAGQAATHDEAAPSAPESATEAQLQETATEAATDREAIAAEPSIHSFPVDPTRERFSTDCWSGPPTRALPPWSVTITGVRTRLPSIASAAIGETGPV